MKSQTTNKLSVKSYVVRVCSGQNYTLKEYATLIFLPVLYYTNLLRGWSSRNEALETNFPNFIFMAFL